MSTGKRSAHFFQQVINPAQAVEIYTMLLQKITAKQSHVMSIAALLNETSQTLYTSTSF